MASALCSALATNLNWFTRTSWRQMTCAWRPPRSSVIDFSCALRHDSIQFEPTSLQTQNRLHGSMFSKLMNCSVQGALEGAAVGGQKPRLELIALRGSKRRNP